MRRWYALRFGFVCASALLGALLIASMASPVAAQIRAGLVNLTSMVTGTLPVGNGGTGLTTLTGLALGNGSSAFSAYAGTSCTNQFPRSLSAAGAATCASVAIGSDVSGLGTNVGTWLGTPSTTNLNAALTSGQVPYILPGCSSGTASSTTNDTNEHNLVVCTIPAGVPGTTGGIQVYSLWKAVGTNNSKTPKIRHSATSGDISAGTAVMTGALGSTSLSLQMMSHFYNSGSASAQILYPGNLNPYATAGTTTALATGAINTANASYINFNGSVTNSGDTLQLVAYYVLVIPGA